jgi:GNAT superfamily N-acetyltransferase
MVHVKTYTIKNIPKDIYQWCLRNNFNGNKSKCDSEFHGNGLMKVFLNHAMEIFLGKREHGQLKELKIYIAHKDGKKMGWGMSYKDYYHHWGKKMFQSFVLPSYRRRGIGTKLLERAIYYHGSVGVYSHKGSNNFYEFHGMTQGGKITKNRINKKKVKV